MTDGTDTLRMYDELAYDDLLPVAWRPSPAPLDDLAAHRYDEANQHLLLACASLDEQPLMPREKADDSTPVMAELARLEFKVTLMLDLLIHVASRDLRRPDPVHVRFNAIGASLDADKIHFEMNSSGMLDIYLRNALPQPLTLAARVVGRDGNQAKLRFLPMSEAVADLIEKLAFRRHRRHVADSRRTR